MMGTSDADLRQPVADRRHRGGRRRFVHGDAHQLAAGARQRLDLLRGAFDVRRVGVGHRLDDDGRGTADGHATDVNGDGFATRMAHLTSYLHFTGESGMRMERHAVICQRPSFHSQMSV